MVFPEGTTGNGSAVTAFRSGAFAAVGAGGRVQPAAVVWPRPSASACPCGWRREPSTAADGSAAMGAGWRAMSWESVPASLYAARLLALPPAFPRIVLPTCPPHWWPLAVVFRSVWLLLDAAAWAAEALRAALVCLGVLAPGRPVIVAYGRAVEVAGGGPDGARAAADEAREACAALAGGLPLSASGAADKWRFHTAVLAGRTTWTWWG